MQPVEPKATVPAAPVKDSLGTSVIGSGVGGEQRQGVVVAEPIGLNAEGGAQGPEIQAFMKEVNTMLQRLTRLSSMKVVDSLEPEIKRVEASMAGFAKRSRWSSTVGLRGNTSIQTFGGKGPRGYCPGAVGGRTESGPAAKQGGHIDACQELQSGPSQFCDDDCATGHVGPGIWAARWLGTSEAYVFGIQSMAS